MTVNDFIDEAMEERYSLAIERIGRMMQEQTVPAPFDSYFRSVAAFVLQMGRVREALISGETQHFTLDEWQEMNNRMYADILPEHYEESYANPDLAVSRLGETHGKLLCFLYAQIRGLIGYVFEGLTEHIVVHLELLIEIYNCFEQETLPEYREIQQILYWFISDYSDVFVTERVRQGIDPSRDHAVRIVMDSDLKDLRYLYHYGEYITENERKTAEFLNSLSEEEVQAMADTYTEGYRIGFVLAKKDLSKKLTVNLRYHVGFERMIRLAIRNFERMGLKPVIYRYALSAINQRGTNRVGYTGAVPNMQYDYDHKEDQALFLDRNLVKRRLGVMRSAYETHKTLANGHAGPAVVEVFGETPFEPISKANAWHLTGKQQKLAVAMDNEAAQLVNQYIIGKERSFTIIAFPVPQIGPQFEEIFRETVKINTLDYQLYQRIQQTIIDALDLGTSVHIKGCRGNRTDLTVALRPLKDPNKETIFENCVADVNIPVGEVFTTPQLKGTNGLLHVTKVYLENLKYTDLSVTFTDGMITDYQCANFETEEENREFLKSNLLFHHDTLPMGEFAIGTNTTAYVAGQKYDIAGKFPILIAEKTGPHFAVGDTCYSWSEDIAVYNPDGKEIIARDNEVSVLRKEDPGKAYFGCHTDITIPYEELGLLEVQGSHGYRKEIIRNGRFVLPGTEELNAPFEE